MKTNLYKLYSILKQSNRFEKQVSNKIKEFFSPAGPIPVLVKSTATSKWCPPLLIILSYACLVVH